MAVNPDCAGRERPHLAHTLAGPGGAKPGSFCEGLVEPVVCRECRDGKCGNCTGDALDQVLDQIVACECTHD